MSDEKKQGHLKAETREKLKLCLEMSAEDTVDLMTEAYGQDIFDKQGVATKFGYTREPKKPCLAWRKLSVF